jgi:hypothetical protein
MAKTFSFAALGTSLVYFQELPFEVRKKFRKEPYEFLLSFLCKQF